MIQELFKEKLKKLKLALFDFDGVFTNNLVYISEEGYETVACSRSDGIGLSRIESVGIKNYVISSETNQVVGKRCEKLKINLLQGVENKQNAVFKICDQLDIHPEECLFMGNDVNDIPALKIVGIPVAVADAYPELNKHVIYKTKLNGGKGAVREICDIIYNFKNNNKD